MVPAIDSVPFDVLVIGGGPAGLAAALTLGRARRRTLVCDDGPRRNAAAAHMQNFVTRDGTPPAEFRRIAGEQLDKYANVTFHATRVVRIGGSADKFNARLETGEAMSARRVLLCTGLLDDVPEIPGMRELWGKAIFQCPYCHAWEVQGQRFAYLAINIEALDFALLLRGWTSDVVVLTNGRFSVPDQARTRLTGAGVILEERPIERLIANQERLERLSFSDGGELHRDVLFLHPRQRQVPLVSELTLATDERGFVQIDADGRTSIPGIYAAGDLTTHLQSAILAAAAGMQAAARLNHELTLELAAAGVLA